MGKQLIYRVWGSKAEVVAQAVLQGTYSLGVLPVPETGDLRVDLESWLTARAEAILAPGGRSVARAVAAGEPVPPAPPEVVADLLTGYLSLATLGAAPLDPERLGAVVDAVLPAPR